MVQLSEERLNSVFHALSDPTRRRMVRRLLDGERSLGELAAPFDMSLTGASKHVRALEKAGIVVREVRGRTHVCRMNPEPLAFADEWIQEITRFWNPRLDALESAIRAEIESEGESK